ncbi:twin-arginine translocase subunit TatC [Aromatoleum aromaticum]|uniref:Sec-independent protein translocase protein TatC n=1 Tax=Aromatoleum aromaticum (strain DSM 19018 / LMG 30748 / EbN1) TaxID=76114 RepID=Q5P7A1_AROAE|nr:twin-arginine translocase subunit TatC [Aromatoleum aromaticum]NMG53654.1 twin-arginine translocase subunit TatC [Aromatoleum aromaticum]CAI06810.1 Sec-independent protein translocase subunit C [Aromatoleum aromaticum EbN1]
MSELQETFISHLVELRDRLLRAMVAVIVVFVCLMPWAGEIYDLLAKPMMNTLPEGTHMIATGVVTPFFVPVKVTMMVSFVLALPFVLYQAWAFIAPGLYAHERRLGLPLVLGSTLLFLLGMAFCYFFVFGTVFKFIAEFAPKSIVPAPDIEQYLSFVMTLFIAFGLTFEVPVAVILLVKAGVVSISKLREVRPYVIVGAFVIAAIITPPDVVSQFMLAVPMCLLYEVGILLAKFVSKRAGTEEPERVEPDLDRLEAPEPDRK